MDDDYADTVTEKAQAIDTVVSLSLAVHLILLPLGGYLLANGHLLAGIITLVLCGGAMVNLWWLARVAAACMKILVEVYRIPTPEGNQP